MSDDVQVKEAGTGQWITLTDATSQVDNGITITIPAGSEFAARLSAAGLRKYLAALADLNPPEGRPVHMLHGVIRSWKPAGDRIVIDVRPAATVEDMQG
ncbi:hypothetical protein [Rhodococcus ruber]|uniref:hypothetical protein n=1 Tax=Rhodococcus ruber TaxID=1830 RepID=UPI003784C848